jgi:hypothetical protein
MHTSDENDLNPCRHGELNPAQCAICANEGPRERKIVYFTEGGLHYHRVTACSALAEGQRMVSDRGGRPGHIETGYLDTLRHIRKPCKTCW